MSELLVPVLSGTVTAATPLILAGIGELLSERAGVLNLGVEGMMLLGAVSACAADLAGCSHLTAVAAAAAAGAIAALLFAVLALTLAANQYAAGLAVTILGSGISAVIGRHFGDSAVLSIPKLHLPLLADVPLIGPVLFNQDPLTYLALGLVAAVHWFLYRTRWGLIVRIVGEAPQSASELGYPVVGIRYATTLTGGAMAGLAGAYLALVYTPLWVDDMSAGRGWIAIALVVFSAWRPGRLLLGAWLFGGVSVLQLFAQAVGMRLPSELLSALPYLATIAVLVMISRDPRTLRLSTPLSLAQPFRPEY